jgi:DNA-binding NtrC family response regulator
MLIKSAMIPITTNSSTKVKPNEDCPEQFLFCPFVFTFDGLQIFTRWNASRLVHVLYNNFGASHKLPALSQAFCHWNPTAPSDNFIDVGNSSTSKFMKRTHIPHVLVVDDIPDFVDRIKDILTAIGLRVTGQHSPLQAIKDTRKNKYDLLITTLVMRELGGLELIRAVRQHGSTVPIMMITGFGSEQAAIEATRLGAIDFLNKPVSSTELVARVNRIIQPQESSLNVPPPAGVEDFITTDPAMLSILETVETVAPTKSRVLITGETGTGKQLIARAIHRLSPRRKEPFIDLNCAAIPDSLLESELFGHERGAFTGADRKRIGRFEEAGAGTLFLDEIGEMGFNVQAKLLKVLQDGKFNRVGGTDAFQSQARVIAATNRNLETEAAAGKFRTDLFYRLQVVTIHIPPLRKRPGDIPLLAEHFLEQFSAENPSRRFSPAARDALMRYDWPGNVRELENLVERVAILHKGNVVDVDSLPDRIVQRSQGLTQIREIYDGPFEEAKRRFEQEYVAGTLIKCAGNMAAAARLAGMDRSQFFRMVKRLNVTPHQFKLSLGQLTK